MATFSMPATPGFRSSQFGLISNTRVHRSPFDQSVQTLEMTGARWKASYDLPSMNRASASAWHAFLLQCRGMSGRFFAFDPDAKTPRGTALGTPLVNGASQTGTILNTDGWTPLESGLLLAGDYFGVNGELKMVVSAVNSDSNGEAAITFEPSLRSSPPNNDALTTSNPTCTMMLASDEQAVWDANNVSIYGMAFSGIEVFS